jgi:peptidoglycan/xylan/chitin deacetylase (PgdA/CDA1 family)
MFPMKKTSISAGVLGFWLGLSGTATTLASGSDYVVYQNPAYAQSAPSAGSATQNYYAYVQPTPHAYPTPSRGHAGQGGQYYGQAAETVTYQGYLDPQGNLYYVVVPEGGQRNQPTQKGSKARSTASSSTPPQQWSTGPLDMTVPQFNQFSEWLTFDDGPHPQVTTTLLRYLQTAGITHATFFFIGDRMRQYPDLVRQVAAAGYTIGYHSMDHRDFKHASKEAIERDIIQFKNTLNTILGQEYPLSLGRPPYGGFAAGASQMALPAGARSYNGLSQRVAPAIRTAFQDQGLQLVLWDVDSQDWRRPIAPSLVSKHYKPGQGKVWLFHEFPKTDIARVFPSFLRKIKNMNNTATLPNG